jgi:hypothetical protein
MLRKLCGVFAVALLLCASVVLADEIRGRVTKVDADKNKVTVSTDSGDQTFAVSADAKITTKTKDGGEKDLTLSDLASRIEKSKSGKGVSATVTTEKKGGKDVVTKIRLGGGKGKGKGDK